jgi:RNA-directed DNA polymerase
VGAYQRVSEMQTKLHRWVATDLGRFDDLFNLVHDPATLLMAFVRVAGNQGARTAAWTDGPWRRLKTLFGPKVLDDLCTQIKRGTFRPLPVRQWMIPSPADQGN